MKSGSCLQQFVLIIRSLVAGDGLGAAKEIEFSHFSMETKKYTTFTKHEVELPISPEIFHRKLFA